MNFLKLSFFFVLCLLCQDRLTAQDWVSYQSQEQINDLLEVDNELLLATSAGLVVINKTTLEKTIMNKANSGLSNNHINSIARASNGDNWIGTYDVVIGRVEGGDVVDAISPDSEFYDEFTKLYDFEFAPNGDLWIGTTDGVFHKQGDTWFHYAEDELGDDFFEVWDIEINSAGDVFLASSTLHKFSAGVWTDIIGATPLTAYVDAEIFFSSNGNLFYGGDIENIGRFDGEEWELYNFDDIDAGLNGFNFIGFTEDAAGNVYFNTRARGIFKLENNTWAPFTNPQTEAFENNSSYFYIDEQDNHWLNRNIHLSVNNDGDIQSALISQHTLESNNINNFHKDLYGRMIFITASEDNFSIVDTEGNWSFLPLPNTILPNSEFINDILYISENDIWVSTNFGLHHYDGNAWNYIESGFCTTFARTSQGKIYVRSVERIYIIEDGDITEYNENNTPITGPFVSSIGLDANDNLWIVASEEKSIYKVTTDGTWTTYTEDEFPVITSPGEDFHFDEEGNVWIPNSTEGVLKFDGITWSNPFIGNFDEIENIDVFSVESDGAGKMYFAHQYGLTTLLDGEWGNLIIEDIPVNFSYRSKIKFDDAGTLWFANRRYGVFAYTLGTMTSSDPSYLERLSTFTIYPNPAVDYLTLDFSTKKESSVKLSIYNNLGQLQSHIDLGKLPSGEFQQTIEIADLPNGFYSVQVQINDQFYGKPIIIK